MKGLKASLSAYKYITLYNIGSMQLYNIRQVQIISDVGLAMEEKSLIKLQYYLCFDANVLKQMSLIYKKIKHNQTVMVLMADIHLMKMDLTILN